MQAKDTRGMKEGMKLNVFLVSTLSFFSFFLADKLIKM